jgi:hypothetical protein
MSQSPNFLTPCLLLIDLIVVAVLLTVLGLALGRAQLPSTARTRTWLAVTAALVVWYGLVSYLSIQGVFQATPDVKFPAILLAVFLPIIVGLWLIVRSRTMALVIDATPLSWLVAIQTYRIAGIVFLVLLSMHLLPAQFALPAGKGDILVGLLAVPVAWMIHKGSRAAIPAAYAWNILGILDFVVALTTGFLTSPGRFQMMALGDPNLLVSVYPLVMIPAFLVPLSSILHGVCIWKLQRQSRMATTRAALA